MKLYIVNTAHFFIGAVFGMIIMIGVAYLIVFTTIGAAVYNARVDQQQDDIKLLKTKNNYDITLTGRWGK